MAVLIHIASGVIVCMTLHNTQACFFQGSLIFSIHSICGFVCP